MRRKDWLKRLNSFLTQTSKEPYHQTTHNCAHFALGAIEAVTGEIPASVLHRLGIELPSSEIGVTRLLIERGGMRGIAETFFGGEANPCRALAQRGDIAVCDGQDGEVLGVVENCGVICLTPDGLSRFRLSEIKGFWPLG
jgi:hypothetical protein